MSRINGKKTHTHTHSLEHKQCYNIIVIGKCKYRVLQHTSGFLPDILLFTQPLFLYQVWFDRTIIDIRTILLSMYYNVYVFYDWWLCMVINISVQYIGGFLPGIILLTQGYYNDWGTRLNTM